MKNWFKFVCVPALIALLVVMVLFNLLEHGHFGDNVWTPAFWAFGLSAAAVGWFALGSIVSVVVAVTKQNKPVLQDQDNLK